MHDTPLPPSFTNNLYSHPILRYTSFASKNGSIGKKDTKIRKIENVFFCQAEKQAPLR